MKASSSTAKKKKRKGTAKKGKKTKNRVHPGAATSAVVAVDPWKALRSQYGGSLSPAEQFERLCSGAFAQTCTFTRVQIEPGPIRLLRSARIGEAVLALDGGAEKGSHEAQTPLDLELRCSSCDLDEFQLPNPLCAEQLVAGRLVSLDLSDNRLSPDGLLLGPPSCWLRALQLRGNRLTRAPPSLACAACLLRLDMSYNPLSGVEELTGVLPPVLRSLSLERCGLRSLGCASLAETEAGPARRRRLALQAPPFLSNTPELVELNLAFNAVLVRDELLSLGALKRLRHLDLRDTVGSDAAPAALATDSPEALTAEALAVELRRLLPRLKCLNGAEHRHEWANTSSGVDFVADATARSTGFDLSTIDGASCSCLEGNPCAVPDNCKDWPNRFEVAQAKRREKFDAALF